MHKLERHVIGTKLTQYLEDLETEWTTRVTICDISQDEVEKTRALVKGQLYDYTVIRSMSNTDQTIFTMETWTHDNGWHASYKIISKQEFLSFLRCIK